MCVFIIISVSVCVCVCVSVCMHVCLAGCDGNTLLEKKSATWNPFCPVVRTFGGKGSQKGSLHVQEPKKVPYTGCLKKS